MQPDGHTGLTSCIFSSSDRQDRTREGIKVVCPPPSCINPGPEQGNPHRSAPKSSRWHKSHSLCVQQMSGSGHTGQRYSDIARERSKARCVVTWARERSRSGRQSGKDGGRRLIIYQGNQVCLGEMPDRIVAQKFSTARAVFFIYIGTVAFPLTVALSRWDLSTYVSFALRACTTGAAFLPLGLGMSLAGGTTLHGLLASDLHRVWGGGGSSTTGAVEDSVREDIRRDDNVITRVVAQTLNWGITMGTAMVGSANTGLPLGNPPP